MAKGYLCARGFESWFSTTIVTGDESMTSVRRPSLNAVPLYNVEVQLCQYLGNPRFLSGVVGRCEAELRRDVLARAFPIEAFVLSRLSQAMHIESFGPSGEGEDGGGESILRARSCCG